MFSKISGINENQENAGYTIIGRTKILTVYNELPGFGFSFRKILNMVNSLKNLLLDFVKWK